MRNGLVLACGKTTVRVVVDHPQTGLEFAQYRASTVARCVVYDDDLQVGTILLQGRFQARFQELFRVVGSDENRDRQSAESLLKTR